jgi:tetratricopeptide (TPR) repeat protein
MNKFLYEDQTLRLNKQAVQELKAGRTEKALNLLRSALVTIKKVLEDPPRTRLLSQIFNTFGNLFKKTGNLEESLQFFKKCVDLEMGLREEEKSYVALAYVSAAAVCSSLSKHSLSLKYATQGINLMKKLVKIHPKMVNSLIIAYHNLAAEFKIAGDVAKAEHVLKTALNLSHSHLGQGHPLSETLENSLNQLTRTIKSRNLDYFHPFSLNEPSKLPEVRGKRSNSDNRDYSRRHPMNNRRLETAYLPNDRLNQSFYQVPLIRGKKVTVSDEESTRTDKSFSTANWNKRIDLQRHKETERNAAVIIQAWWRGLTARKEVAEIRMKKELKIAEIKAKKAMEEYEKLKGQAMKMRKKKGNYF